jgi:hypothetical protein
VWKVSGIDWAIGLWGRLAWVYRLLPFFRCSPCRGLFSFLSYESLSLEVDDLVAWSCFVDLLFLISVVHPGIIGALSGRMYRIL